MEQFPILLMTFCEMFLLTRSTLNTLKKKLFLVCDTGHMSRVTGSVLAEERFNKVYSLKKGMRRWYRW
jgi:rhodanese-related sulfurtransferase